VALLLNAVLLAGVLVLAWWLLTTPDGWSIVVCFVVLALVGAFAGEKRRRRRRRVDSRATRRAERALTRLSLLADLDVPELEVISDKMPLSWTTALPGRRPRIHVTTGVIGRLGDAELESVIAHELSHIGNRDAVLMTVLAAPGVFVLRGLRASWHNPDFGLRTKFGVLVFACAFGPVAMLSAGLCRIVSRHRELAADRGAGLLTGSPAALAAALMRLSGDLRAIPGRDLPGRRGERRPSPPAGATGTRGRAAVGHPPAPGDADP
jgi:heat shock protein HtpX